MSQRGHNLDVSPLAKKLQLKPRQRIAVVNALAGFAERLRPLPDDAELAARPGKDHDVGIAFARDPGELKRVAASA